MFIAVSNNRAKLGKIPPRDEDNWQQVKEMWRVFNGSFQNVNLESRQLAKMIQTGYAYTAQHNRYRKADNFIQAQHICLDMDTEDERSTFEALLQDEFIRDNASFLHTTPSHTAENPKARVFFELDKPIKNQEKYALLMQSLVFKYEQADRACKDPARFFYGADGCMVHWLGNILTLEKAARTLVTPYRDYLTLQAEKARERAKNRVLADSSDVPEAVLRKHSDKLIAHVENAPKGQKHITLRDIAATFGGYIANGYYNELDVIAWLQVAIRSNPNEVKDFRAADETIIQGIRYGRLFPLYFELRDGDHEPQPDIPELHTIYPPLTELQKAQVQAVIRSREWEMYHKLMGENGRNYWYGLGVNDELIDRLHLGIRHDDDPVFSLTFPCQDINGQVVNVEYLTSDNSRQYECELIPPIAVINSDKAESGRVVIAPSNLDAVWVYDLIGDECVVTGLPQISLRNESLDHLAGYDMTLVIEPDTSMTISQIAPLRGKSSVIRLPIPFNKVSDKEQLMNWISQAKQWK